MFTFIQAPSGLEMEAVIFSVVCFSNFIKLSGQDLMAAESAALLHGETVPADASSDMDWKLI